MDKRGQFYIIMAIIIGLVVYSLYLPQNKLEETVLFEDFKDVSVNYLTEAPKVINHYVYKNVEDENLKIAITDFTTDFLKQIRQKNPNINLVFLYSNGTHIFIKSYYDQGILFEEQNTTKKIFGEEQASLNSIKLKVSGKDFEHEVPVKMKNFGNDFTSTSAPLTADELVLEIGGIFHTFPISTNNNGNEFQFLLEIDNGEVKNIYNSGSNPYNLRF